MPGYLPVLPWSGRYLGLSREIEMASEAARARSRKYYAAHREEEIARTRSALRPGYHREYNARNRDRRYARWLWSAHGMQPEDWAAMWNAQQGCCYLCGGEMSAERTIGTGSATVAIDHDHRCCPPDKSCSVCRRGMAHSRCNQLIGLVQDNPDKLQHMASALRTALTAFGERKAEAGEQLSLI
jgi:hypothetical protein